MIAAALIGLVALADTSSHAQCAFIAGPATTIAEIQRASSAITWIEAPDPSCVRVSVEIEPNETLVVTLTRQEGPSIRRPATDTTVAAIIVESWCTIPAVSDSVSAKPSQSATSKPTAERTRMFAGPSLGVATDGTFWSGATLSVSSSLGDFELGLEAVFMRSPTIVASTLAPGTSIDFGDSYDAEGLLALAWRIGLDRISLAPAIALGVGFLRAADQGGPDGVDQWVAEPPVLSLRTSASLAVALQLLAGFGLEARVDAVLLPDPGEPRDSLPFLWSGGRLLVRTTIGPTFQPGGT